MNYISFDFRFPVGSTSAAGWQNRLDAPLRFLFPKVTNQRIKKIGVYCMYNYETTGASANEATVTPWYQAIVKPLTNDGFLINEIGRTPDPVIVKGLAAPVSINGLQDVTFQMSHHNNWIDTDFEGNGILLERFGYYNIATAPATANQIEVRITIGYEPIQPKLN